VKLSRDEFREMLERGTEWAAARGMPQPRILSAPRIVSDARRGRAVCKRHCDRPGHQPGGFAGFGNHYLEIQVARPENIVDADRAAAFGITRPNQIMVMLHCGSRGFGHQVASDYLKSFLRIMQPKFKHHHA